MTVVSPSAAPSTTDATTELFHGLEERGHEPALEKATGMLRFDISDGGSRPTRWTVEVKRGDLAVSHRNAKADCVVRADHALFDGIARGEVNPVAAILRGALAVEGDLRLLLLFTRLLPDPPRPS
jgi:putative sterol carrier protein